MSTQGKILIVDDMPVNVKILSAKFRNSGYEVFTARDGEEAIKIAREEAPDVMLLDVMMPGMDGLKVTRVLKGDPETEFISIILVTALKSTEDVVAGLGAGADDFVTKPANQSELLARTNSMVKLKKLHEERKNAGAGHRGSLGRSRLLIIDDDSKTSALWVKSLDPFYDCESITEGGAGLTRLEEQPGVDLIILDLLLPDMHGLDFLKTVKADSAFADIPVIIISGMTDQETRIRGLELGADDYMVKPVNSQEVIARVRAALRKGVARSGGG